MPPKKRNTKAGSGRNKGPRKNKATSSASPSPTATPPATDIPPAPQTSEPVTHSEPNNKVEVDIQPSQSQPPAPSPSVSTDMADTAGPGPGPGDSTVLVEHTDAAADAQVLSQSAPLDGLTESDPPQLPEAEARAELPESADELVELVESIAESETDAEAMAMDSTVPSSEDGFVSSADVDVEAEAEPGPPVQFDAAPVAEVEVAVEETTLVESISYSTPSTPPRSNGNVHRRNQSESEEEREREHHPHLRRAASTSYVASCLSTSPGSHGRSAHKHLRFTSASEEAQEDEHHVYYPRKRNINSSDPGTPSIAETAHQIRRTISFASLDNLIQLQTDPEHRERFVAEVARAGRDLVWRDKDDHPLYPRDGEQTFVLASKRALRSFILSFTVRSGVNVVLLLFKTLGRRKKMSVQQIRTALIGEDSWRFGAMIGSFTFLNTLTYHMLRLAPPASYIRKRLRAGLFSQPTFGPPEREGSEGEHRWHAAAAGGVASLALFWETAGRRRGVSQQMFVRGLQGAWNQYTPQAGVHIPFGNIVLFGLCCGQIMFGFLLAPETIPRDYYNWIQGVSGVPTFAVASNRTAVRQNVIHPEHIKLALDSRDVTKKHVGELRQLLENSRRAQAAGAQGLKANWHIPCSITHPWEESCSYTLVERFFRTFRFMLPVYGALHLIPPIVLRRHAFAKDPLKMLARITLGITRSCSFLGFFIIINQALFCMRTNALDTLPGKGLGGLLRTLIARKETFWIMGFLNALSLFAEERKRRTELAMYVFPKALESAWASARKRAWVPVVPFGDTVLGAAALAMVMDSYVHSPESLSGIVRRLLFQLVGPV